MSQNPISRCNGKYWAEQHETKDRINKYRKGNSEESRCNSGTKNPAILVALGVAEKRNCRAKNDVLEGVKH
jgi:hypothetical protein